MRRNYTAAVLVRKGCDIIGKGLEESGLGDMDVSLLHVKRSNIVRDQNTKQHTHLQADVDGRSCWAGWLLEREREPSSHSNAFVSLSVLTVL